LGVQDDPANVRRSSNYDKKGEEKSDKNQPEKGKARKARTNVVKERSYKMTLVKHAIVGV